MILYQLTPCPDTGESPCLQKNGHGQYRVYSSKNEIERDSYDVACEFWEYLVQHLEETRNQEEWEASQEQANEEANYKYY